MPTTFCPGCGKSLSAGEAATGFCPGCGKPLPGAAIVPVSPLPAPPPPRPAPRPERTSPPAGPARLDEDAQPAVSRTVLAWGTVRAGLALTVFGAILLFASAF